MKSEYTNQEINWHSKSTYVDIETGEILEENEVIRNYIIIKITKETHVYKKTGTIAYTKQCFRSRQLRIFE